MLNARRKIKPKKIAFSTACEAVIGLSSAYASSLYLTPSTTWIANPFTASSCYILINFLLRVAEAKYVSAQPFHELFIIIRGLTFGLMDYNRGILVHEAGHVLLANILYESANPRIQIDCPYFYSCGAVTAFDVTQLSQSGLRLGANTSRLLVYGAGVPFNNLFAYLGLMIAHVISNNYPELKTHIRAAAAINIMAGFIYALSPYIVCEDDNDFCQLQKAGIPPVAPAFILLAVGLILQFLLSLCSRLKLNSHAEEEPMLAPGPEIQVLNYPNEPSAVEIRREPVLNGSNRLTTTTKSTANLPQRFFSSSSRRGSDSLPAIEFDRGPLASP